MFKSMTLALEQSDMSKIRVALILTIIGGAEIEMTFVFGTIDIEM